MDKSRISSCLLFICFLIILAISSATDTISGSQTIRDGETLVSSDGRFELGFFRPGNSTNWYLGMWYRNIPIRTYVWVANREVPLRNNSSGVLRVTQPGILALYNETNGMIWSTNTSRSVANPAAQLLNTGNLVVRDANDDRPENYLWQNFDYPSDTLLLGMTMGWNWVTGLETYLTSWRSDDDPAPGEYSTHVDPTGYPQMFVKRGDVVRHRVGPWNGVRFSGAPDITKDGIFTIVKRMDENEVRFGEDTLGQPLVSRYTVSSSGASVRWIWESGTRSWEVYRKTTVDNCDNYNLCGSYGICNGANSPPCQCPEKFVRKDRESGIGAERSSGCIRRTPLNCSQGDVFLRYSGLKMPDARNASINDGRMSLADCKAECLKNCSCTAYKQLDMSKDRGGCLFYHGELFDMKVLPAELAQDIYVRMDSSESDSKGNKRVVLIASLTSAAGVAILCLILIFIFTRKRKKNQRLEKENEGSIDARPIIGGDGKEAELPFFSLSTILQATDHFSNNNKLGEGGFGPVYKGMLDDGQEIAVKRLSKTSSQGLNELKNEVILIAKLQHRNLVRTLGCCVEGEENMLIYEYMPNHSLDLILFDQTKSMLLDWRKRFHIINGIAKGILYLHQDSRLRIIHRDLKASNVLLDADMNPKISDFGLARSFGGNETEAQTRRVVGTYGYMSPEYAIDGLFSVKSDVFSFGILVLEIVSGKRNRGFFLKDHNLNLVGHAWRLYKEDNPCKLLDPSVGDSFDASQVLRSIHVGLLCVQKSPEDRPSMSSVVLMLGNEGELPPAKQPGFFTEKDVSTDQSSRSTNTANSENQVTISWMEGR